MVNAKWESWIEAPKSANIEIQLRKWASTNNVSIISMYSKDCHQDLMDKFLGIRRETVFFHLEGDYEKLSDLRDFINKKIFP